MTQTDHFLILLKQCLVHLVILSVVISLAISGHWSSLLDISVQDVCYQASQVTISPVVPIKLIQLTITMVFVLRWPYIYHWSIKLLFAKENSKIIIIHPLWNWQYILYNIVYLYKNIHFIMLLFTVHLFKINRMIF